VYSDQPSTGAKQIDLQPVQSFEPPSVPESSNQEGDDAAQEKVKRSYEKFAVVSPANDDTIRNTGGEVDVAVDLRPPLKPGDTMRLLLDGQAVMEMTGPIASLTGIERGTHTVVAEVVAESGKVIATTDPVTFHYHQTSALN
jgi:hypothetical protein